MLASEKVGRIHSETCKNEGKRKQIHYVYPG